jgi:hypothetical protein
MIKPIAHRDRVHWVVTRDGEHPRSVGHDNVFALLRIQNPALSNARTASR